MSASVNFDDYTFDGFDALDFDAFDLLDGFATYPASFYQPDVLASMIADHLSFLVVLPKADSDVSAGDRQQIGETYRGLSVIRLVDEGHLVGGVLPIAGGLE
jgi:hypothetical protein